MQFIKFISTVFVFYLYCVEVCYLIMKYIKKDLRFQNISLFKFIESPVKTFKGDL